MLNLAMKKRRQIEALVPFITFAQELEVEQTRSSSIGSQTIQRIHTIGLL